MTDDDAPTISDARHLMRRTWGYESFRPGQEEVLSAVLNGEDVLGVLPTGGGKSLCYQIPALLSDGFVLVLSPLIALMQDQVEGLRAQGIDATFINSTLTGYEVEQRWTDVEHGRYDLLYMAPERLSTEVFQARADRLDVSLLAVDEAHCVSEWGHHFRPDYREIPEARAQIGEPPTMAVTATATPAVRDDVVDLLDMPDAVEVVRGFDRPNIVWSVFRTEHKWAQLRDVVEGVEGTGIVYAATRRGVKRWTKRLRSAGVAATGYHGRMAAAEREKRQQAWLDGEVRVMVATNAFGMGIDKPDVRFVVHAAMPDSLEAYYQEAGRAGRDGEQAYAVLLFQEPDAETQESMLEASHPTAEEVRTVYDAVCNVGQVPLGSEPEEPLVVDRKVVQKITEFSRTKVRTAVELLDRQGAWRRLPNRRHYGLIRFREGAGAVRQYANGLDNRALARFVRTLLRLVHADAFSEWWPLDVRTVARRTELSRERLGRGLQYLEERGLLEWRPPGDALQVDLCFPRAKKLPVDDRAVQNARQRAETRLTYMLRYARSVSCRRHFLLTYFGERSAEQCGACDVCLGRHEAPVVTPEDESVLRAIVQRIGDAVPREEWFDEAPVPRHRVDALVNWLVERGWVTMDDPLDGTFSLTDDGRAWVD
ncbi:helicase [Salinibacter sp. 10B]|uniref:RecQ family ATP-dependent DNA helicase n=1 Tax=Salinibacter sp. 10B TaxID=1923971 RepID=UPI000CF48484|nr:ATP-dependent DNA helicase RecQ [Salinibacter sp. 10B]PQJ34192.1 helicase [Salinibacter sp. 10B]